MSHISFYLHILELLMILDRYENHVVFRNPSWCVRGCHTSLTTKLRWRKGRSTISPRIWEVSRTRKMLTMPIYRLLFFCPLRSSFSLFVVIVKSFFCIHLYGWNMTNSSWNGILLEFEICPSSHTIFCVLGENISVWELN